MPSHSNSLSAKSTYKLFTIFYLFVNNNRQKGYIQVFNPLFPFRSFDNLAINNCDQAVCLSKKYILSEYFELNLCPSDLINFVMWNTSYIWLNPLIGIKARLLHRSASFILSVSCRISFNNVCNFRREHLIYDSQYVRLMCTIGATHFSTLSNETINQNKIMYLNKIISSKKQKKEIFFFFFEISFYIWFTQR